MCGRVKKKEKKLSLCIRKYVCEYSDLNDIHHAKKIYNNINDNIINTLKIIFTVMDNFHRSIALQSLKFHRKVLKSYFCCMQMYFSIVISMDTIVAFMMLYDEGVSYFISTSVKTL